MPRQALVDQIKALSQDERERLASLATPRIVDKYLPHIPHPPQQFFLTLPGEEAMFGGAAGGGKSDALLMAALQYVDVPGYSALLLRRTWPDLSLPGAIMERTAQWLSNTDAKPKDGGRKWIFPCSNGKHSTLTFGYLQYDKDKYRYQSAEFQFIGFDELTQFEQPMYEYMFSRLRRPALPCLSCKTPVAKYGKAYKHTNRVNCNNLIPDQGTIAQYPAARDGVSIFNVPLRMRSATNPGGTGHVWVREKFIDSRTKDNRAIFVPSRLTDNPSLDQESYERNLGHLNLLDRQRLLDGDWDVSNEGEMFKRHWFTSVDDIPRDSQDIRFWDMASTEGAGDWTAGLKLRLDRQGRWWIEDVVRFQKSPHETERIVLATAMQDGRYCPIRMEQEPGSSGVITIDHYSRNILRGFDFKGIKSSGSKEVRAKPVSAACEVGNVSMLTAAWNRDFLDEVSLFPHGAHDDQVDALSGAFGELAFGLGGRLIV